METLRDLLRIKVGNDPPESVQPYEIMLKNGAGARTKPPSVNKRSAA